MWEFLGGHDKRIGVFKLSHYPSKEVVYESDLRPGLMVVGYGFYLDKLVYNLGEAKGTELYNKIFVIASGVVEKLDKEDDFPEGKRTSIEKYSVAGTTEYRLVNISSGDNPLVAVAELWERKNGSRYVQTHFSPKVYPDTEGVVAGGCEALFIHLFNEGDKQTKFFLPMFIIGQVNWYQENGYPGLMKVGQAPYAGMAVVRQIGQG